jgi:hypothetical protein
LAEITLFDNQIPVPGRLQLPENWYAEPFTKRTGCKVPGQCGGDCDCGCPYNTMTDLDRLPLIETVAAVFPNEWLAFIISPEEDDEYEPVHGKLVAHSPDPDEIYDAVNTVLWNQHVYVFFNGEFAHLLASYGDKWAARPEPVHQRTYSGPKPDPHSRPIPNPEPLPADLVELIYSAVDRLYGTPNLNEAIRRLRLSRVRAANGANDRLATLLDQALDRLEGPLPRLNELVWYLEEGLAELDDTA